MRLLRHKKNTYNVLVGPVLVVELFGRNVAPEHVPSENVLSQMERQSGNCVQRLEQQKVHVHICFVQNVSISLNTGI